MAVVDCRLNHNLQSAALNTLRGVPRVPMKPYVSKRTERITLKFNVGTFDVVRRRIQPGRLGLDRWIRRAWDGEESEA